MLSGSKTKEEMKTTLSPQKNESALVTEPRELSTHELQKLGLFARPLPTSHSITDIFYSQTGIKVLRETSNPDLPFDCALGIDKGTNIRIRHGESVLVRVIDKEYDSKEYKTLLEFNKMRVVLPIQGTFPVPEASNRYLHIMAYDAPDVVDNQFLTISNLGNPKHENRTLLLCTSLARTIAKLHSADWAHNNLNPATIMLRKNVFWRFSDVTSATNPDFNPDFNLVSQSTPCYRAPEVLAQFDKPRTMSMQADLFSLGLLMYRIATGSSYFNSEKEEKMMLSKEWKLNFERLSQVKPEIIRDSICKLLNITPAERPSAEEIAFKLENAMMGMSIEDLQNALQRYIPDSQASTIKRFSSCLRQKNHDATLFDKFFNSVESIEQRSQYDFEESTQGILEDLITKKGSAQTPSFNPELLIDFCCIYKGSKSEDLNKVLVDSDMAREIVNELSAEGFMKFLKDIFSEAGMTDKERSEFMNEYSQFSQTQKLQKKGYELPCLTPVVY